MQAIKETGNNLVAILDKSDSVGIIDRYFPNAALFLESERFDRHIYRLSKKGDGQQVDYVSVCSPNYLHDAHIRLALRNNAHAICEKPLVLNTWNLDGLEDMEKDTGKKIFHILQLRLHPSVQKLKEKIDADKSGKVYDIDLTYITGRGKWYFYSWKADMAKSGGITTNIGVHFFDMLTYIFGQVKENIVHYKCEGLDAKIELTLKYGAKGEKVITGLKRISKPGLRIYAGYEELPKVLNGMGIAIVSTPKGVMTDKEARKQHHGGEILAYVW